VTAPNDDSKAGAGAPDEAEEWLKKIPKGAPTLMGIFDLPEGAVVTFDDQDSGVGNTFSQPSDKS